MPIGEEKDHVNKGITTKWKKDERTYLDKILALRLLHQRLQLVRRECVD